MTARLPESATGIARCREILKGEADPLAYEWDSMAESERVFWLHYARLGRFESVKKWRELSGDSRCRIKNSLYRAASRASLLLKAGAAS